MARRSSDERMCRAFRSGYVHTATVAMPISLNVYAIRIAISPRFAMRTFRIIRLIDPWRFLPFEESFHPGLAFSSCARARYSVGGELERAFQISRSHAEHQLFRGGDG